MHLFTHTILAVALLPALNISCGRKFSGEGSVTTSASVLSFADSITSEIRSASPETKAAVLLRYRTLSIEAFYQLLFATSPRDAISVNGQPISDFSKVISRSRVDILKAGQNYRTVGEVIEATKASLSLPTHSLGLVTGFGELYRTLNITESATSPILRLNEYNNERTNECLSERKLSLKGYECYGDYKVTEYREDHIEEHLRPNLRKPIHTIFTNEAVIGTLFTQLSNNRKPIKGPLQEENGNLVSWYPIRNAGTSGEQYVKLVTRDNNVVVTAFPVSKPE